MVNPLINSSTVNQSQAFSQCCLDPLEQLNYDNFFNKLVRTECEILSANSFVCKHILAYENLKKCHCMEVLLAIEVHANIGNSFCHSTLISELM